MRPFIFTVICTGRSILIFTLAAPGLIYVQALAVCGFWCNLDNVVKNTSNTIKTLMAINPKLHVAGVQL